MTAVRRVARSCESRPTTPPLPRHEVAAACSHLVAVYVAAQMSLTSRVYPTPPRSLYPLFHGPPPRRPARLQLCRHLQLRQTRVDAAGRGQPFHLGGGAGVFLPVRGL